MKATHQFAIGVDYGTNSVRSLVVDIADGREVASHVYDYPSGEAGVLLEPKEPRTARQNPADYIEGFYASVGFAVQSASFRSDLPPGPGRGHRRRYDRLDAHPRGSHGPSAGFAAGIRKRPCCTCLALERPYELRRGG